MSFFFDDMMHLSGALTIMLTVSQCCPAGSSYKSLDGEGGCCPDDYDYYGQGWCIYRETGTQTPEVPPVEPPPILVCPEGAHVMYLDKVCFHATVTQQIEIVANPRPTVQG